MTKETNKKSSGLEILLETDEGLEGRLQTAYAQRQDTYRRYEGVLRRLKEQCQTLGSQVEEMDRKLAIVKAGITQTELEQTADELAWFEEIVQERKEALLREMNGNSKGFPGKNA